MMQNANCSQLNDKKQTSPLRKQYIVRLVGRCVILLIGALLFFRAPDEFDILNGWNFFKSFLIFHILWVIWVIDMVCQLIPIKKHIALGSQKLFRQRFKPIN